MTVLNFRNAPRPLPHDLASEASHRTANHLAALLMIIKNEISALQPGLGFEEVGGALNEMIGEIPALSSLQRRLAARQAQGELDLVPVLSIILKEFQTSGIFGDRLHIGAATGSGCMVEASRASLLALVLSEIATNAVRYAHPTGLPVEISIAGAPASDGGVVLEIADDGVGLPEGFVEARDSGLGLKLMRTLVGKLDGRLAIQSDPLGLTYTIQLPPS